MFHVLLSIFFFVKLDVTHTLFFAVLTAQNECDVFPLGRPHHIVAKLLHLTLELRFTFTLHHAMIDGNAKLNLPAVSVHCRAIFLGTGAICFFLRIVFFQHTQSMRHAYLIAPTAQLTEKKLIVMQLDAAFEIISTNNQVIMNMLSINMRGD